MRQWRWIAVPMIAIALTACGGSGGSGSSTAPTNNNPGTPTGTSNPNTVTLNSSSFTPPSITVSKGTTVSWQWAQCDDSGTYGSNYGACVTHQIVFDDGSNQASATQSQGTFNRTFDATGTFKYHCSIHGAAVMSGQVTVQ